MSIPETCKIIGIQLFQYPSPDIVLSPVYRGPVSSAEPGHCGTLLKMRVDKRQIVDCGMNPGTGISSQFHGLFTAAGTGQSLLEEILRSHRPEQEHIVIEINKVFRKSRNPVYVHFNGMGIKGRQVTGWYKVPMIYNTQLWMPGI